MNTFGKRAADIAVWLLLLSMPYWLNWIGGYTSLGSRVLVLALAAALIGALIVRLRGVYFRYGDDRFWTGVLFHRFSLEFDHRR